jgi:chromosome segregation ATPase
MSSRVGKEPAQTCRMIDRIKDRMGQLACEIADLAEDLEEIRDINSELRQQRSEALDICDRLESEMADMESEMRKMQYAEGQ